MFTTSDYVDYCISTAKLIEKNKDYISELDAATGDGDHWANMNMGFQKLVQSKSELKLLSYPDLFKKIGIILMSTIGGSSGALYGSAYIRAAQVVGECESIDAAALNKILSAMLEGICKRGNSSPGMKTMVDTLSEAVKELNSALQAGSSDQEALERMEQAAQRGMESTKDMPAVRGRAYYQADKGIGHLDPGAVTMYYQLKTLAESMIKNEGIAEKG